MLIHLIVHGCFHVTAERLRSCDRDCIASRNIYPLDLYKESLSTCDLNRCDILLSDDSQIVKEGKKLWLLRDIQPSCLHWRRTG